MARRQMIKSFGRTRAIRVREYNPKRAEGAKSIHAYGGRLLAVVGPVLSILLMVMVIGAFAFRRMQGPTFDEFTSNSNYNTNDNSTSSRFGNYN